MSDELPAPPGVLVRITRPLRHAGVILCPTHLRQLQVLEGAPFQHEKILPGEDILYIPACLLCGVRASPDRRCANDRCAQELHPQWPAVYCCDACAREDA